MKFIPCLVVLAVFPCVASFNAYNREGKNYWESSDEEPDSLDESDGNFNEDNYDDNVEERELSSLVKHRRGVFDCKQRQETCKAVVPCCGTLQCYWPAGYTAFKSGHCVDCVQRNQLCQRDSQCCSPLVCHKGSRLYVDGNCGDKRYTGSECHDNDQCRSGKCNIGWADNIKGYGGVCT